MDGRHDLTVDHPRLLAGGGGFAAMDNPAQGSQQLRPPYGDLCRPPGSDASSLSAAYHSRYLASMPLSTGSSFPFIGNMFPGSLPAPPTSPFRTPSTPGVNNMRQFWPPTPPPDGYGRYSMNTNLFPLFATPSPENGAFLTQGLVSRLGATTHLSPLIDHKEHSFFSHGIGLGSPLTPTSHVASPTPFPHLIPSLERHPAYGGHMTLGSKELEELQHEAEDARLMKSHMDCLMKHDIPSSRQDRPKSKNDGKHCCDKANDECCKLSPSCIPRENGKSHDDVRNISKLENKNHTRHPMNKVQPCKIEVSHSPTLKADLLSPPIESPKSEVMSPCRNSKKTSVSPFSVESMPTSVTFEDNPETRCSQCAASMKGIGVATKLNSCENKGISESVPPVFSTEPIFQQKSHSPVVSTLSFATPVSTTTVNTVSTNHSRVTAISMEGKPCYHKSPSDSPVITVPENSDKTPADQSMCKLARNDLEIPSTKSNNSAAPFKHVTAAVIPTAPKQTVHRDIHPDTICSPSSQEQSRGNTSNEQSAVSPTLNSFCTERHNVKLEVTEPVVTPDKVTTTLNHSANVTANTYSNRSVTKNLSTSCKVKDMIKSSCTTKQMSVDRLHEISSCKTSEIDVCNKPLLPNSPSPKSMPSNIVSTAVSPSVMAKSPCKSGKVQSVPLDTTRKCSPFKDDIPVMKAETVSARLDCEFSQKSTTNWTKATVLPFSWQNNSSHDDQAINLTVSKKSVKPEPHESLIVSQAQEIPQSPVKITSEGAVLANTGVVGVCHPNPNPIAINKMKTPPAVSSISNFASISVLNQPAEQATEVHILHRSSKSSFPVVNRNGTSPVPLKSSISHVTANASIHRSVKTERMTTKRGKLNDVDKLSHNGRATLATLAPKLSKNVNFGKDVQTSHTLSAASSVSSTSIVFPATVNPCIPVGIAIAQQRQDSSSTASIGKSQSSVPSSTSNAITSNAHLAPNRVTADLQAQEIIRDQKSQDLSCSNNPTPVDANLLVTQGPTIVSRQWESEALTRTALPSSWVTHGSIVAPAVWLGQGAYAATAAPTSNTVPSVAMNSLESSPISLPPGGYQLARDSITGHLLLIPTANIELMDRTSVWPSFNSSTNNMPIQQLVTQQQHTQFEQVLPQADSLKANDGIESNCNITTCDISAGTPTKGEDKIDDVSGQVPSVPLATGQTYAFTTFPTQCDPSSFSYVLQSSTVMHLAHTQTTASIQTESGRRSQGTSPLHCATPSPPPNTCSVQVSVTEDEEESGNESDDVACCETTQVQPSCQSQSVTTAIQVDMDSQTNSEEDEEEERKMEMEKTDELKVEMSDSANQTESVPSESPKSEADVDDIENLAEHVIPRIVEKSSSSSSPLPTSVLTTISIKDDMRNTEPGLEIVTSETELAPSLPVESKPVMDFIDHHGLNLLVDSIEEFASREQEAHKDSDDKIDTAISSNQENETSSEAHSLEQVNVSDKTYPSSYKTIDTSCTDGLGLLCALAEQRFFEEAMNVDENKTKTVQSEQQNHYLNDGEEEAHIHSSLSAVKDHIQQSNSNDLSENSSDSSSSDQREATELDMRLRLVELQKKYRQKQRELELLRNRRERENSDDDMTYVSKTKPKKVPEKSLCSSKRTEEYEESSIFGKNSAVKSWQKKEIIPAEPIGTIDEGRDVEENSEFSHKNDKNKLVTSKMEDNVNKVPSITLAQENSASLSGDSMMSYNSSDSTGESYCKETSSSVKKFKVESNSESSDSISKHVNNFQEQDYDKNDKTKIPFFDEQAWFVRRSERIFLSDARSTVVSQISSNSSDKSSKKHGTNSSSKVSSDASHKDKKEQTKSSKLLKAQDESEVRKGKNKGLNKPKLILPKKRSLSDSCDSNSSCDDEGSASENENSDGASSTSDNLPLSIFVEKSSNKVVPERPKRFSVDSECSDVSSGQSEDIPLSVLIGHKTVKYPELKSCILTPDELQEHARLLVLDEGLFYAGHITKSEDPDMFGILIDGERAARPHMFSKEEILNAAVLEVKPTHKQQLPEGSRICAFWSQQYRCLYPGTVTKTSSPMPDPTMLYVEFDDGDSGRIPLNDIRMLPPDFPIVSMEPNPFMILGKRRSRTQSQNGSCTNDVKTGSESSNHKCDKERNEHKKHKTHEKSSKKIISDGTTKNQKEPLKSKSKSPSNANRSRSSSKSSNSSHVDAKNQSNTVKKDLNDEDKKKSDAKSKYTDIKSKDCDSNSSEGSASKPKKHKKHKEDHHKHHHHHHHKHHHHKKHKTEKLERRQTSDDTVIPNKAEDSSSCLSSPTARLCDQSQNTFILENSKSELTVKIKKSPSPHTTQEEASIVTSCLTSKTSSTIAGNPASSDDETCTSEPAKKKAKKSKQTATNKPAKRKDRLPSVEKSKIAAFLPVRQLWRWSGKSFRRPGAKGKAKKEFYRAIQRGKETIRVGDCAVFLSTGRPHLPYIGRIETMWESWGGKMDVKVKWFYHPEETKSGKKLSQLKGALFQSPHFDENDVQTISHKCEVLSWDEYQKKKHPENNCGSLFDNNDTYFLAGTYDPIMGTLILEPGVPGIPTTNFPDL